MNCFHVFKPQQGASTRARSMYMWQGDHHSALLTSATHLDLVIDVEKEHCCTVFSLSLCTKMLQPRPMRVVQAPCASTAQAHFNASHPVGVSQRRLGPPCRNVSALLRCTLLGPTLCAAFSLSLDSMGTGQAPAKGKCGWMEPGRPHAFRCFLLPLRSSSAFVQHVSQR